MWLWDLLFPIDCVACGDAAGPLCSACRVGLGGAPQRVRPVPAPVGLPPCWAADAYDGPLREILISYKERGVRSLAQPLGELLVPVVGAAVEAVLANAQAAWRGTRGSGLPKIVVVPVPATAAARRRRLGDHVVRLLYAACRVEPGWRMVSALAAAPRVDSTHLGASGRAARAMGAFRVRSWPGARLRVLAAQGAVVLLADDILTTGATAASAATTLVRAGVPVHAVVTVAATERRLATRRKLPDSLGNKG